MSYSENLGKHHDASLTIQDFDDKMARIKGEVLNENIPMLEAYAEQVRIILSAEGNAGVINEPSVKSVVLDETDKLASSVLKLSEVKRQRIRGIFKASNDNEFGENQKAA